MAVTRSATRVAEIPEIAALEPAADDRRRRPARSSRSSGGRPRCWWPSCRSRTARRRSRRPVRACARDRRTTSTARVIASGEAPARRATAAAARTSPTRWRPSSRIESSGTRRTSPAGDRSAIQPPLDDDAVGERRVEREPAGPCPAPARERQRGRIVGVDHDPVAVLLVGEHPRLRARVLVERRVPVEVIRRDVQQHRDPRAERLGRLELEAARPRPRGSSPAVDSATCALSGGPMLPPTTPVKPACLEHPAGRASSSSTSPSSR